MGFRKTLVVFIVFLSIFSKVCDVGATPMSGYLYSKSLSVDYFTIANAYDDLSYTCVYDDYIYILNDTKLQEISLETSLVIDEIEWSLLSSVSEFMRKGNRIFIDATIDAVRTIICVDIETFVELAQVPRTKLSDEFTNGLENVEYFDCNNHDIWVWGSANSSNTNNQRLYSNVYRGRYVYDGSDMEWCFISGFQHVPTVGAGDDFLIYQHMYNESSDSIDEISWNMGATTPNYGHWFTANSWYNPDNNTWVSKVAEVSKKSTYMGANGDDQMNLQYDFRDSEQWLDVTWGEWGVRDNPNVDSDPSTSISGNINQNVWMDTDDRVFRYHYYTSQYTKTFTVARFDKSVGFITWISGNFINHTALYYDVKSWGLLAIARYDNPTYGKRTFVGYVNNTDNYPKAEYVLEVGGTTNYEAGTIEFEYNNVVDSRVYTARKNIIAIFTIDGDNDNLYVCRNLIDRNLLSSGGYVTPTLQYLSSYLYKSDGSTLVSDGWLFMGEAYNLVSTIQNMTTYYMEMSDGVNTIRFTFDNETKSLGISCDEFVAGLVSSSVEELNVSIFQYQLTWKFVLNKEIVDCPSGVYISYYGENEPEGTDIDGIAIIGLKIYNLGGHVSYEFQGDAGRKTGGDALEIHHTNSTGNGAYVDVMFRRLQHVHLAFSLDVEDNDCFDVDENSGIVQLGFKYWDGTEWDTIYYAELSIVNGAVDPVSGTGKAFIIPYVSWNSRQSDGVMTTIKSDVLSGYPECADDVNSQITYTKFYLDLWFNTMNSSTTIGGRLSTKYFGMVEETSWFFWSNWKPVMVNMTESMFFDDLRDESGDILQVSEIELVKFFIRVLKSGAGSGSCDSHTWTISDPEFSYTLAGDRMQAVKTPDGIDTIVIDMPSSGLLQPLTKAIEGIGNAIWASALNFIKILIGATDSLLNFLNSPVSMSQMIEWVMIQTSYITSWISTVVNYASSMLTILNMMFTQLLNLITYATNAILWVLTYVIVIPLHFINYVMAVLSGGTWTIGDITIDFSPYAPIIDGIIDIAPIFVGIGFLSWIFWGNTEMRGEIDESKIPSRLLQVMNWFREVYQTVYWSVNKMQNMIIELYNFIRSHIPGMGGSGGNAEE